MTTPRQHSEVAILYFSDNTLKCWARNEGSNSEWTLMPDPRFNVPGLEYYVGHKPPPPPQTHHHPNGEWQGLGVAEAVG